MESVGGACAELRSFTGGSFLEALTLFAEAFDTVNSIELSEHAVAHPWFFLGAAVLLGAFHGMEPGHSKGMMAAFLIGTRGTYFQAILLALCATLSHTAIVWVLAWPASYGGAIWSGQEIAPYLNLISGLVVLALAYWILRRFNRANSSHAHHHHDHHDGDHDHDHHHHDHDHAHSHATHAHGHHHAHERPATVASEILSAELAEDDDAHARHHAREIAERFSGQAVSTSQVALFGLTSGLTPCTAAIVILITCFRLHQPGLGLALVAAFSLGLGLTLTAVALLVSWGMRALGGRWRGFEEIMRKAPLFSALVTGAIGLYLIVQFFRSYH